MGNHGSSRPRTSARLRVPSAALAATALATAAAFGPGAAGAAAPSAKAARTLSLSDSANLKLDNHKGTELKESGTAKGTLVGPISVQLRLASQKTVTARIQLYSGSSALDATATASYRVVTSSSASFSGTLTITGGRGRFAKAKGSKLVFSGTVHRPSDAVSVHVSGKISY